MRYKKILLLTIILAFLLAISAVSAQDNTTSDVVRMDQTNDDVIHVEEVITDEVVNVNDFKKDNINNDNVTNNQNILGNDESQDNISLDNDKMNEKLLTREYPSSSDYSARVSDTTIGDAGGEIFVAISPAKGFTYYSCCYLKIYDSHNKEMFSQLKSSKLSHIGYYCRIGSGQLDVGTYTIKIINYADGNVMDTAKLTVKPTYPSSSEYSVRVSDTTIDYGVGGTIFMRISPASRTLYGHYYYLKIFDSKNDEKISNLFWWDTNSKSESFAVGSSQLDVGTYTIKIINYADGNVMDTAKLTVNPTYPSSSDYSVNLSDVSTDYGTSASIFMRISPSKNYDYKYCYYLKVFDSNNKEMISKLYNGTYNDYSISYNIGSSQMGIGTYTIKIINYADGNVMDTAKLTVNPTYPSSYDYSVFVFDTTIDYGVGGSISMSISPSKNYNYKYCYYLRVYDSNNKEKISRMYADMNSASSKIYDLSSYNLSPGTYTIKIINYKDNIVMDTAKLSVKLKTYVSAENIRTTYGISKNLIVSLKDANDNLVIGKAVSVKLNGKTYSGRTNYKGQISINVPNNLAPKTYVASITFNGGDKYLASSGNVNVVVTKATPKITVKSITGNVGKYVKLTALVKDGVGNKVSKCTVIFRINGKTYKAKTNFKGIATLKIKIPKSKIDKVSSKIKNNIAIKTTLYKKTYTCKASVIEDNRYKSSSAKFKVISKNKKIQRYKIVKKEVKTITVPYKHWGIRYKTVGHYRFAIIHEQREGNKISIVGGDRTLQKFIKFSSRAYYIFNGQKVFPPEWSPIKNYEVHYYYYTGNANIYIIIKFNAYTYKKI